MSYRYGNFPPYVSVAKRRQKAAKTAAQMAKRGEKVSPIRIEGRTIAKTFWGKGWCDHLESFSDFANRLPRGRTYVRNGSVIHLNVSHGQIEALVQGSSLYKVNIEIKSVADKKWQKVLSDCSGQIDSIVELLQGKLSSGVMKTITDKQNGLFPQPKEISLHCSCPDWAEMCKHVAAVLYGVGARLDKEPELLFKLRNVDHLDLISKASLKAPSKRSAKAQVIEGEDLSNLFGIEMDDGATLEKSPAVKAPRRAVKKLAKKTARKKRG